MKRLFYLFVIIGLVVVSCQKPAEIPTTQDVTFKATPGAISNFKDDRVAGEELADCTNLDAAYAIIVISGVEYTIDVFYLDGIIYTETIKLPVMDDYEVTAFGLYDEFDVLVQATPLVDSEYENFVEMPLPFFFDVDAFFKTEINIEILCFVENFYTSFGFAWFTVEEVTVYEACFFGDICIDDFLMWRDPLYIAQQNGLQHDMPAIFMVEVWRTHDGLPAELLITYDNEYHVDEFGVETPWYGEGAPLCVKYPDFKNVVDLIEFKLFVRLDGVYTPYHTFSTTDNLPLFGTGDLENVLDFVWGDCVPNADFILPWDITR